MSLIVPVPITPLTTPPSAASPSDFDTLADVFLGGFPTLQSEVNAISAVNYSNAQDAYASSLSSVNASIAANLSATAAAQAANAAKWISGTSYTQGVVTWSPINFLAYRRKVTGAGTIDPGLDTTNWSLIGAPLASPIQVKSTSFSAVTGIHYILTASLVITLPSTPGDRDTFQFTNRSGVKTITVNPSGKSIRGSTEIMTINTVNASGLLIFSVDQNQWV